MSVIYKRDFDSDSPWYAGPPDNRRYGDNPLETYLGRIGTEHWQTSDKENFGNYFRQSPREIDPRDKKRTPFWPYVVPEDLERHNYLDSFDQGAWLRSAGEEFDRRQYEDPNSYSFRMKTEKYLPSNYSSMDKTSLARNLLHPYAPSPREANLFQNIWEAEQHHYNLPWFQTKVRKKDGPWDYKRFGPQYENFGNFNYGATGAALGLPLDLLLRAAGSVQTVGKPQWNSSMTEPPYGDDPVDQFWIKRGYYFYRTQDKGLDWEE